VSRTILITARDPAAALHLIEVARAARERPGIALAAATQEPATTYFRAAGMDSRPVALPAAKRADSVAGRALLDAARTLIAETRPDATLSGLSTPFDGGIDEAVTAVFEGPRFVMQDFWGEANLTLGRPADLYFTLDDEGARMSAQRHGVAAMPVGSPRHSAYAAMNVNAIRAAERARLGIDARTTIAGFFGQALHGLEGYRRTLEVWTEAVLAQRRPTVAFYRPHPRETEAEAQWTFELMQASGADALLSDARDVEHALLACDVVCSAFSNCTYDAAYLNHFSREPLITPMALLFDEEIVDYFRRMVRLREFPYLKAGLAKAVRDPDALAAALEQAAGPEDKALYWNRASALANPAETPARILDAILARLDRGAGAGTT